MEVLPRTVSYKCSSVALPDCVNLVFVAKIHGELIATYDVLFTSHQFLHVCHCGGISL